MASLHALLHGELPPQVYRLVTEVAGDKLRQVVLAHSMHYFYVDGSIIDTKSSFLRHMYQVLHCPDYVGSNWDAFEEAIRDLAWLTPRPKLLLYDYVDPLALSHPRHWATALNILQSASEHWRETGCPLYVLLSGADSSLRELPAVG